MSAYVQDADLTIHVGDCLQVLAGMPDASVDCVVTSPPYWGLRDYGTGQWDGGDPDCDHAVRNDPRVESSTLGGGKATTGHQREGFREECPRCGARRVDQQLGLEPTPDQYVTRMVTVFREVRRVLAPHGTCWVNLGDSYSTHAPGRVADPFKTSGLAGIGGAAYRESRTQLRANNSDKTFPGLKPKDLVGIPWRIAFALQADGWYLRSDIIWSKPNPMPESVTDRPTKAHEYVFLLSKRSSYWFDQEAVREPHESTRWGGPVSKNTGDWKYRNGGELVGTRERDGREFYPNGGRNVRSVWEIATQPYAGAHFATYPEELVRRCVLAGCPEWVCRVCGVPRTRLTSIEYDNPGNRTTNGPQSESARDDRYIGTIASRGMRLEKRVTTEGWSDCGHNNYRPGVVLDPFLGSGTTALVARKHGRHSIGIELNEEYARLAAERTRQLSLLGGAV